MTTRAVLLALVISTPGLAAASEPAQPSPAERPRMVCRHAEAVSGSRMSRERICRPAAYWRALHDGPADDTLGEVSTRSLPQNGYLNGVTPRGGSPN